MSMEAGSGNVSVEPAAGASEEYAVVHGRAARHRPDPGRRAEDEARRAVLALGRRGSSTLSSCSTAR